ncbi:nitric oxide synthase oxygenase [Alkalihalobacillus sp. LMS6]|uniref:nitric oxide synthase oxygenase n=1 Tax=Alkalihalobacillus sp. LMS6 TaxID=2924034 RepID=UPI0020D0FAD8|nr:nitric oxide synthase oxygenase [Alkalihalobacillus sp. LMS6]UTR07646.1 nitric oxide synthase oxygenase [Alkalihalobacillus sp. LMS6]
MEIELGQKARAFIKQFYEETGQPNVASRLTAILAEINKSGTYTLTTEELTYGAKLAWRNSNRCIGRLFWERMHVIDAREAETEEDVFKALCHHLSYATNEGKIIPTITVFPVGERVRIWNHQLIRYAGYEKNGRIIGDPASLEFTRYCQSLGWTGAESDFDLLPFVFSVGENRPVFYPIPDNLVKEVELEHPTFNSFKELALKWYAVPIIADMRLEIGGLSFYAAPFNGWYMGTEIGARNLADDFRYNRLEQVADRLGINRSKESSLWRDEALVELNRAVLHSFQQAGVSIVDHHTAAKQFQQFIKNEEKENRSVTGDWTWLIPPMSPAQTKIFHQSFHDEMNSPNFFYEDSPYK